MKILKILAGIILIAAVVVALIAPVGPLPGFFIGGTATAAPAQWPDTSAIHEIRLKVPGALPRVVIIWVVAVEQELYVVGAANGGWPTMIGAGAPVEMRLGYSTYALQARPVTEGWEPILTAYVNKYRPDYPDIVAGFPSVAEAAGQMAVFKLERG